MKINLPYWPMIRVLNESIFTWNIRHSKQGDELDIEHSSWPRIRVAVLAFMRHRLTDYDLTLARLCRHDEAARNKLVAAVNAKADIVYPWLRKDPRPLPVGVKMKPFDVTASRLSIYQSAIAHLQVAAAEAKRLGDKTWLADLNASIGDCQDRFQRGYQLLTAPKHIHVSPIDGLSHSSAYCCYCREPEDHYEIMGADSRRLWPYEYKFLGFSCPNCQARVIQLKRRIDLGQNHPVLMFGCFCLNYAVNIPPPGHRLTQVTAGDWAKHAENRKKYYERRPLT